MENASKALIMAGAVLLAMLIIGSLVFMFNSIRDVRQEEASAEDVAKLAQYGRQVERFNKAGLYGSEILSLANLIDDYNLRQADLKGYTAILLEVHTNPIRGIEDVTIKENYTGENGYLQLIQDFTELENEINNKKDQTMYGQTVEKLAGMRTSELEQVVKNYNSRLSEEEINNIIYNEIDRAVTEYQTKKSELTEFKNKQFQMPEVEYDEFTGRIISMKFWENGLSKQ